MMGVMDSWFGATLVVSNADGQSRIKYKADGTFTEQTPTGAVREGAWSLDAGQLCMKTPGLERRYPAPARVYALGETWTEQTPIGPATLKLEA